MFLCILQKKCSLPDSTRPLYSNHTVIPVYLVHKTTTDRSICMLYKIIVCSEESFHFFILIY